MIKLNLQYYTSYYSNFRNIPKDYLCIGISRFVPIEFKNSDYRNFIWASDNFLAPSESLLYDIKSDKITQEEYSKRYIEELIKSVPIKTKYENLLDWIIAFDSEISFHEANWKAVVFMCYEKPTDFCHRHILRKLLNNYYKIPIEEFNKDNIKNLEIKKPNALF